MRVENWESKLNKVIQETINKDKFKYGKNDCITFTQKCVEAITNKKIFKHKWKSLKEGKELSKVQRGDVLYFVSEVDFEGTLGVCIGSNTMFNWSKGVNLVPNNKCKLAWRIE